MQLAEKITDQELIIMCREGKDFGYTGLYNKYAKRIYNSISRLISHTAEAEDILQETFFTVFSEPEKLVSIVNFEAWVRRMAINRSISHLRKKKISFSELDDFHVAAEEEYDAEENEIFDCKVKDVKRSIEALSEGYKTILNLYVFEKMTHDDIATMLGLSSSTVRTQYHRAKKRVLESLKDKCYDE